MAWDEEEDTTTYNKADYSPKIQKVLTTAVEKNTRLLTAVRRDAPKALAPYNLTPSEIKEVSQYFRR